MGCLFNAAHGTEEKPARRVRHCIQKYDSESKFQHVLVLAKFFRAFAQERAELFDLTSPHAVTDELARIQSLECFLEHLVAIVLAWKQSQ